MFAARNEQSFDKSIAAEFDIVGCGITVGRA